MTAFISAFSRVKRLLAIAAQFFALALPAITGIAIAEQKSRWPFGITPAGEPNVGIPLMAFPHGEFIPGLSLRHELVFDGVEYASRLIIPEIRSYLVAAGRQFRWVRLDGAVVMLERSKPVRTGNREWSLKELNNGIRRVVSQNEAESYDFERSLLIRARVGGREYQFENDNGRLQRVMRNPGADAEELVALVYDVSGSLVKLQAGGCDLEFEYDRGLRLETCVRRAATREDLIVRCRYRDGLLVELQTEGKPRQFTWAQPALLDYGASPTLAAPVVTSDGVFGYRMAIRGTSITTHFRSERDGRRGQWQFDLKNGRLRMATGSSPADFPPQ